MSKEEKDQKIKKKPIKVYLVDTSGSMDESRKKNQLLASLDKIEPDYLFAFDTEIRKPSPISCSALKNLPFNGGTAIGKCLHDMFERLKTYNEPKDKKKKTSISLPMLKTR